MLYFIKKRNKSPEEPKTLTPFQQALLDVALEEFADIPDERGIHLAWITGEELDVLFSCEDLFSRRKRRSAKRRGPILFPKLML